MRKIKFIWLALPAVVMFFLCATSVLAAEVEIVNGTLQYPDGSAAENVHVEMHTANADIMVSGTTNSSGYFSFSYDDALLNGKTLTVELTPPTGYNRPTTNYPYGFTYTAGEAVRAIGTWTLVLAPKTINVAVVNNFGIAVDADVVAYSLNNVAGTDVGGSTGADGLYSISITGGNWYVKADANLSSTNAEMYPWMFAGNAQKVSFLQDSSSESVDLSFTVTTTQSRVQAKFLDSAGAILTGNSFSADVTFIRSDGISTRRKVNSEGIVDVYLLPGIYRVWPDHPQITDTQTFLDEDILFILAANETKDLGTIQAVNKGSYINGSVKDQDNKTVSGAQLLLTREGSPERQYGATDNSGNFSFRVGPGTYTVVLGTSGLVTEYTLKSPIVVTVATNNETVEDLTLNVYSNNIIIEGTVKENDVAVENFNGTVVAQSASGSDTYFAAVEPDGTYEINLSTSAVTAKELEVTLTTQPGADLYLPNSEKKTASVAAGTYEKNLALSEEDAVISGNITDMSGNHLTDLGTNITIIATNTKGSVETAIVGTDGTYSMTVAPGDWTLGVKLENEDDATIISASGNYLQTTAVADNTVSVDVPVAEKEAIVSGTVTDNEGHAVSAAPIVLTNSPALSDEANPAEVVYVSAQTNENGNYSASVPAGTFTVSVGTNPNVEDLLEPQLVTATVAASGTADADLSYRTADKTLSGEVSVESGKIMDGVVIAYSGEGGYVEAQIDSNNGYSLALAEGEWKIVASGLVNDKLYASTATTQQITNVTNSLDITMVSTGQEVPGVSSITKGGDELIAVGNEDGVVAMIEPYSAVFSGDVSVELSPVPEISPTANGLQASLSYELRVTSEDKEITQLNIPATIVMPVSPEGEVTGVAVDSGKLAAQYWSPDEEMWQPDGLTGVVDTENDRVIIQTDHLSRFCVLGPESTVPAKIQNVKVPDKFRQARQVKVRWQADNKAEVYKIQLRTKKGTKIKTFSATNNYRFIRKKYLVSNKAYKVRVRGANEAGETGAWSDYVNFRTLPERVKNLSFDQSVSMLRFSSCRGAHLTYQIKLMDENGKQLRFIKSTKSRKVISNLEAGNTYKFKVRAKYNKNNIGAWSKVLTISI